jgi:hypothetical protein
MIADLPVLDAPLITLTRPNWNTTRLGGNRPALGHKMISRTWKYILEGHSQNDADLVERKFTEPIAELLSRSK